MFEVVWVEGVMLADAFGNRKFESISTGFANRTKSGEDEESSTLRVCKGRHLRCGTCSS